MRIVTNQLIRDNSPVPLEDVEYLDLSGKLLCDVGGLAACPKLRTVILRENNIEFLRNLDSCIHLWNIDLTSNRVKILSGLSCFPILGSLLLGSNELDWHSLKAIRHITILKLSLAGNSKLDSDLHYRAHVVDVLPNIWVLDGLQVTEKERKDVKQFFKKSEATAKPIRPKMGQHVYLSSQIKKVFQAGAIGISARHLMSEFPPNCVQNAEWDKRRLSYLLYLLQEDIKLARKHYKKLASMLSSLTPCEGGMKTVAAVPHLKELLEVRRKSGMKEKASMLLLLIVASLEFGMPLSILQTTFQVITLENFGSLQCINLLKLPPDLARDVASILISAEKLDKDFKKADGGLYDKLYVSLCFAMESLFSKPTRRPREPPLWRNPMEPQKQKRLSKETIAEWNCVIACEVVELMSMVPPFLDGIRTDEAKVKGSILQKLGLFLKLPGLMDIITRAKKDANVPDVIRYFLWKSEEEKGGIFQYYHEMSKYLNGTGRRLCQKQQQTVHRTSSELFPVSGLSRMERSASMDDMYSSRNNKETRILPKSAKESRKIKKPEPGDIVYVDNEFYTKVIAVPQGTIAVIKHEPIEMTPLSRPQDGFFYCDVDEMQWDRQYKYWTTTLSSFCATDLMTQAPSNIYGGTLYNPALPRRPVYDAFSVHYVERPSVNRPYSGKSLHSDDLQTIPSEEELEIDDDPIDMAFYKSSSFQGSPSRYFPAAPSSSPTDGSLVSCGQEEQTLSFVSVTSETDFQRSIVQQYTEKAGSNSDGDPCTTPKHVISVKIPTVPPMSPEMDSSDMSAEVLSRKYATSAEETGSTLPNGVQNSEREIEDAESTFPSGVQKSEQEENIEEDVHSLQIPTPKVKLSEMWESNKSIPNRPLLSGSNTHSCVVKEVQENSLEEMDATMMPEPLNIADAFAAMNFSVHTGKPDISIKPYQHHYGRTGSRYTDQANGRLTSPSEIAAFSAASIAAQYSLPPNPRMSLLRPKPPSRGLPQTRKAAFQSRPATSFIEVHGVGSQALSQQSRPYTAAYSKTTSVGTAQLWKPGNSQLQRSAKREANFGKGMTVRKLGGGKYSLLDKHSSNI